MHIAQIQKKLKLALIQALKNVTSKLPAKNLPRGLKIDLDIPKDYKHGDLTTNVAMRLSKTLSTNSVQLAGLVKEELKNLFLSNRLSEHISKMEVSPPGFINFRFSKDYLLAFMSKIINEEDTYGKVSAGRGVKVNIEFVSANPTGPLTIAHGRQAAIGDALGRILEFSGYTVRREYFINDVGIQIELLGKSIHARYLVLNGVETKFPQDGYHGKYINLIANKLNEEYGKRLLENNPRNLSIASEFGVTQILKGIKSDLNKFGVSFDKWFSQKKLSPSIIRRTLSELERKGYIYKKDGATWFKSSSLGDDKDRVVIKSDGAFTYLAPDIAYHRNKYKRNFNKLIDIWGPDHHGYIRRLQASVEALGHDKESLSILIVQLATLFRNGVILSMSTRKGEFITLKEVMDEVGYDVTKFFFLMRKLDSHLDFDLEVAKKNSLDNPVYYIQYAHARIASIFEFSRNLKAALNTAAYKPELLKEPEEELLLRLLCQFPIVVEGSANALEPYRVVDYLNELAKVFHNFYTKHRVVSEEDLALTKARLSLVRSVKVVLANGLRLLGVSLPERM